MNPQKKLVFSIFTSLAVIFLFTASSQAEDNNNTNLNGNNNDNGNSNINTNTNASPFNINSNSATQTASGEVSTSGIFSADLEKEQGVENKWWVDTYGPWGHNNYFKFIGNKLYVTWDGTEADYNDTIDGERAYIVVDFNENGDILNTQYGSVRNIGYGAGNANFCAGDDGACKFMSYATLHVQSPRTLTCGFNCDQKNVYNYDITYQAKKDNQYSTIEPTKAYKCEEIKGIVAPRSEWFGSLTHTCAYRGGSRLYTIDTISPPTNLSACSDQTSCLATGTEYALTPTTFGKGVQKVSADFTAGVTNSLNSGSDTTVQCANGLCIPYASGSHAVSLSIPETSYFGSCRGTTSTDTVEGKTITTPEVNINTGEAKIPGGNSTLNFNVVNRAPLVSVSLSKNNIAVNEEVTATCDVVDPDSCSDKIIKVKWTCLNAQKEKVDCYFGSDGIWKEGSVNIDVPEAEQKAEYRSIVKWKAGVKGIYAITCEGTDNDLASSQTGIGGAGMSVDAGQVAEQMKYCAVLSEEGGTNKTVCGDTAKVNLKAYQFGIDPGKYEWKCKNTETFTTGAATKECAYTEGGTFVPGLRIFDNKSSSWIDCTSDNNTVKVTSQAKCVVLVRPVGSTDDYKAEVNITSGEQVEAKIERECTKDSNKTVWTTDGTKISGGNTKATIKYLTGGIGSIRANIGSTTCTGASVNISDKVKMGN